MTGVDHLHAETQSLRVYDHLSLLSSQFLARTLVPSHPSHPITTASSGPRTIRQTLQSRFLPNLTPYLTRGTVPPDHYKHIIQSLHTTAVTSAIAARAPNRVLNTPPPPISDEETSLPRRSRSVLSQLRSGFCSALNSYLELVGRAPSNLCPSCHTAPHTTAHLFSCPAHPTPLRVEDLWDQPCAGRDGAPFYYPYLLGPSSRSPTTT